MKISIVIPVYNEEGQLGACLQSIAKQVVRPFEVVIVDNNSTDKSVVIARAFDFVRVVREPRQGVVYARDRGFDAARGDIIARIDADTVLPADWLAHIEAFYGDGRNRDTAFSGGAAFYNVRFASGVSWLYNLLAFDFNRLLIGHPTLWGSNMALPREQWLAVHRQVCNQRGTHEDLDLALHVTDAGYSVFYDRHFKVGAHLRRVRSNYRELWGYLQWWPRTLRLHGKPNWWLCWLFGCLMLYMITPLLTLGEYVARLFGRRPLTETQPVLET
jgi:glycosyltransferase involved in cell wall biosynthesis